MQIAFLVVMTVRRMLAQAQYRTPAFSLLLGSIASALGSACALDAPVTGTGGAEGVGTGGTTAVGTGGTTANATVVATHALCLNESFSLIDGLNPAIELDSLAMYTGGSDHLCTPPDYELAALEGQVCASAPDEEACVAEVERLRANSVDWGKYVDFWTASFGLLVATGSQEAIAELGGPVGALRDDLCGSWGRGAERLDVSSGGAGGSGATGGSGDTGGSEPVEVGMGGAGSMSSSDHVTSISDRDTLLTLLGTIDTASEGALVLWANDFSAPCSLEELADGRYRTTTTEQISDCPVTYQDYEVVVTPAGEVSWTAVGAAQETDVCVGRRPHGLESALAGTDACDSFEGQWLADVARLETAAVVAFAQTSRFLERYGAPAELVRRVRVAALDEIRHARQAQALATARGARAQATVVELNPERSLVSLALENAVEGCIRECWGALLAHYQARAAEDPAVREFFRVVAEEESSHALLSLDLADWFDTRLTDAERQLVLAARQRAIEDLAAELARDEPRNAALGLPDRATRLALVRELEAHVWRPLAA